MSEEERRRCILLGGCTQGASRESALIDELNEIVKSEPWAEGEKERDALPIIARELLARGFIGSGMEKDAAPGKGDERGEE